MLVSPAVPGKLVLLDALRRSNDDFAGQLLVGLAAQSWPMKIIFIRLLVTSPIAQQETPSLASHYV